MQTSPVGDDAEKGEEGGEENEKGEGKHFFPLEMLRGGGELWKRERGCKHSTLWKYWTENGKGRAKNSPLYKHTLHLNDSL